MALWSGFLMFPFPDRCRGSRETRVGKRAVVDSGDTEAADVLDDLTMFEESGEGIADGGCPHAAGISQSASGHGLGC